MNEPLNLQLILLAAAILTLLVVVWQPVVLPRYPLGAAMPLGLSWCTAPDGRRVGLQVLLPVGWWRELICLRASIALRPYEIALRLHLMRGRMVRRP